jgi:hemerythrin-like domain-containing protein
MDATEILIAEQRVIESVIYALDEATNRGEKAITVRADFFLDTAKFIQEFADSFHHKKEEGVLFIAMNRYGVAVDGGPLCAMLDQHEQARDFTRGLLEAAPKFDQGDPVARLILILNARGYAFLMREHIRKEEHKIFPLAN